MNCMSQNDIQDKLNDYGLSLSHLEFVNEFLFSDEPHWEFQAPGATGSDLLAEAIIDSELLLRSHENVLIVIPEAYSHRVWSLIKAAAKEDDRELEIHVLGNKIDLLEMEAEFEDGTIKQTKNKILIAAWTNCLRKDFQRLFSEIDFGFTLPYNPMRDISKDETISFFQNSALESSRVLIISSRGFFELPGFQSRVYRGSETMTTDELAIDSLKAKAVTSLLLYTRSEEEKDYFNQLIAFVDLLEKTVGNDASIKSFTDRIKYSLSSSIRATIKYVSQITKSAPSFKYGKIAIAAGIFPVLGIVGLIGAGAIEAIRKRKTQDQISQHALSLYEKALEIGEDTKLRALIKYLTKNRLRKNILILSGDTSTIQYLESCIQEFNPNVLNTDTPLNEISSIISSWNGSSLTLGFYAAFMGIKPKELRSINELVSYDVPEEEDEFIGLIRKITQENTSGKLDVHFLNDTSSIFAWEKSKIRKIRKQIAQITNNK